VARWASDRLGLRRSMAIGLLLIAAGFAVVAAGAWVPDLAEDGRLGLCIGALSSVSGLIVLVGSSATGSLLDLGLPAAVPWLVLATVPALAVALLPRRTERAETAKAAA
jgi:hypothetical protein